MHGSWFRRLVPVALLAASLPATAQVGALTAPRDLSQLTERAAHIVRGTVTSAVVERHPELNGLHTVVVTLRVRETLKGPSGRELRFRQYLWNARDRMEAAGYRKGDQYLLLLIEPSRLGLSSPAGMAQGRFRILRDREGRELAVNGHGNHGLFDGLGSRLAKGGVALSPESSRLLAAAAAGPVDAAGLGRLIRELVDASR